MTDEEVWRKRFQIFALVRLFGVATFLFGVAIAYSDLVRPGGWPLLGGILAICGVIDAVFAPKLLRRYWESQG
jgi:hypothetical protein